MPNVPHVGGVNGRLVALAGEGPNGLRVGDGIGHVSCQHVRRGLAFVDELAPVPDARHHERHRDRQHPEQHQDQQRRVAPQHHRDEPQRHDLRDHLEREDVEHVLEPARVAERALGERAGEVVVEEREVLRQQLVHRLDIERLDAGDFRPCDERLGPPPHDLAREPQGRERQHIRREHANRERVVARDRAEELGHDERRRVEDEHVADARQDEGRHRNRGTPCDLSAVTTQHEPDRLVQASGVTAIGSGRHYSVLKAKGPSPQSVMALAKSVRARLATSPGNTWARMAAIGRRDREHPRAGEGHSKQADHRPAGESMTR